MPSECLADIVVVIPCSQFVRNCFLSLLDGWLILCLSFFALSKYVVIFCPCCMSGWSSACHSLLSACMWLCFVPAGCLADPLLAIPCSQEVCGCVLSLLHVWLILYLSFLALSLYVVVFCPCWMSLWSSACDSLLSACMWLCFIPAVCLTDSLLVISCSQFVCRCVLTLPDVWLILCLSFLALRMYVVVFCPSGMSGWSSACHSLLSVCMWLCFVPAKYLADPLLVIPCF